MTSYSGKMRNLKALPQRKALGSTAYIEYNPWLDEYVVLGVVRAQDYYTDSREDAYGTARAVYGADCRIVVRRKRKDIDD